MSSPPPCDLDLGDARRAQLALMEREAELSAVLDAAVDGIVTVDARGIVQSVNAAVEDIFGYSADELIGHNIKKLMPSPYREEHDGHIERYLRTGEARIIGIGREVEGRRKDGSTFPWSSRSAKSHSRRGGSSPAYCATSANAGALRNRRDCDCARPRTPRASSSSGR